MMRVIVALLLLVPAAAGQMTYDLELEAPEPGPPIAVDVEEREFTLQWRITCTPEASPGAPTVDPATLTWDAPVADAPGIVAVGKQSVQVEVPDCASSMQTDGTHIFRVGATRDAPGLAPVTLTFHATLAWGAGEGWTTSTSVDPQITVAYVGLIHVQAPSRIQQAGPGETSNWTVDIRNVGNAPSYVLVQAEDERVDAPEKWPPEPLAVEETRSLDVRYRHPDGDGWNNDEATFRLVLTPVSAADESLQGEPVTTDSLARTRGVPATGILVALGAVALAVRRTHG